MPLIDKTSDAAQADISFVMPCYNEESIVSYTVSKLEDAFAAGGYRLELVAVDNGSRDRTGEILRGLAAKYPRLICHRVENNEGYGNGVLSGIRLCTAPWVGIIPADGQVDAEDVVRLFDAISSTSESVVAKVRRRFRMDGFRRKLISVAYNVLIRILWPNLGSMDVNGTPKILRRNVLLSMGLESKDWFLDPEIMIKAHALGLRTIEFNTFARMRGSGVSHVRAGTCWEFLRNLLKYRFGGAWKRNLELRSEQEAERTSCAVGAETRDKR